MEQHQLNLMSGMLMKAGGLGEAGGVGVHVPVPPWKQVRTFSTSVYFKVLPPTQNLIETLYP